MQGADTAGLKTLLSTPELCALFLDIDGTLVDLADTPDAITPAPDLAANLDRASIRLGGALALVTGRALAYADQLFAPIQFPIAGLHGTERRAGNGAVIRTEPTPQFIVAKKRLANAVREWPDVLVEDKGAAIAAHFRRAPQFEPQVSAVMQRLVEEAGPGYELQHGKMVVEIRPDVADKGRALQAFLAEPSFAGRRPIAIGDDVTDEAMFHIVNQLGGISIRIGELGPATAALKSLPNPRALRSILAAFAAGA